MIQVCIISIHMNCLDSGGIYKPRVFLHDIYNFARPAQGLLGH